MWLSVRRQASRRLRAIHPPHTAAGAARAARSAEFTERALGAIEETGRHALEDLERVLRLLRLLREDAGRRPAGLPGLTDAERLLESARAAGCALEAEVTGPLDALPGRGRTQAVIAAYELGFVAPG